MVTENKQRVLFLVLVWDCVFQPVDSTHYFRVVDVSKERVPYGAWDCVVVVACSLCEYHRIAAVLDGLNLSALRVIAHDSPFISPEFRTLPVGEIWQFVPRTASGEYWRLIAQHLLFERRLNILHRVSDIREAFLLQTSYSQAMLRFRREAVSLARSTGLMYVMCECVDQEARALASGVQAFMPGADGEPCFIDGSAADASVLLRGDSTTVTGVLVRHRPLIIEHPSSLAKDLIQQLFDRLDTGYSFPVLFLVTSDELRVLRGKVGRRRFAVSNLASVVRIPPFRNRPEEIWWHVEFMTQDPSKLSSEVMAAFLNYQWGSLAELKSACTEFLATGAMPVLSHEQRVESCVPGSLFDAMTDAYRCSIYVAALESTGGRVGEAANRLGIPERTFRRHTTELNVPKERFRASGKRNKKK